MGRVADYKRFAVFDGPGIRTTVFLKGCPLHCQWCHNPENLSMEPVLACIENLCTLCGDCARVCPEGCHRVSIDGHVIHRAQCMGCGECEKACLNDALKLYGMEVEPWKVVDKVMEDVDFFQHSGGGVTLSGGEPLIQPDFCYDLLESFHRVGVHTAIDTCGNVPWRAIEKVAAVTDLFLYDVKHANSEAHRRWTGQGNELILENLHRLCALGQKVEIRIPIIPGCNDGDRDMDAFVGLLAALKGITAVRLLPYHSMASSKYCAIGMRFDMPEINPPDQEKMREIRDRLLVSGINVLLPGEKAEGGSGIYF